MDNLIFSTLLVVWTALKAISQVWYWGEQLLVETQPKFSCVEFSLQNFVGFLFHC